MKNKVKIACDFIYAIKSQAIFTRCRADGRHN